MAEYMKKQSDVRQSAYEQVAEYLESAMQVVVQYDPVRKVFVPCLAVVMRND